jgi:Flp pilus assembly protein TadG
VIRTRVIALVRSLAGDERGVSMVEFAFLLPLLALLVAGIIDLSQGFSHRFALQQALNRSLEIVQANRPDTDSEGSDVDYAYLVTEAATAAGVTPDKVTLTRWRECDGARQPYIGQCAPGVEMARYVELQVRKDFVGKLYLKTVPVTATAAVRVQ